MIWMDNTTGHPRMGLIVPKFQSSAVARNRLRRRLREIWRRELQPASARVGPRHPGAPRSLRRLVRRASRDLLRLAARRCWGPGDRCRVRPRVPRRRLLAALIRGYQRFVSPALPPSCRFHPSCSQYALEAVTRHGALKGGWLAARRLARCHPFHPGGFDPVP